MLVGLQELSSFLSTKTSTELVVDRSAQSDLLKISFNIRWGYVSSSRHGRQQHGFPCNGFVATTMQVVAVQQPSSVQKAVFALWEPSSATCSSTLSCTRLTDAAGMLRQLQKCRGPTNSLPAVPGTLDSCVSCCLSLQFPSPFLRVRHIRR